MDNWINHLIFSLSLCSELVELDDSIIFEFLSPWCSNSYLSLTFNYIEVLTFSTFKVSKLYFVFCATLHRSVRAELPFYCSPTFLEIYIGLLLTLVIMLFLQTFYLILRWYSIAFYFVTDH